jgi:hypothetical protein
VNASENIDYIKIKIKIFFQNITTKQVFKKDNRIYLFKKILKVNK